jgi:anti-sigma regulatory factor (Ser/Thr protein kinase)
VDAPAETRTFGISASEIGAIDCWVEAVGGRWGTSQRTVFAARLCIAELAANVFEHGAAKVDPDQITVTLSRCGDGIRIEFVDTRGPFDPTSDVAAKPTADLDAVAPRGHGLGLLHAYADELSYRHNGMSNIVSMKIKSGVRTRSA